MIHNKYYKLSYDSHIVTEIVFCHICPRTKYRIYMDYEAGLYIVRYLSLYFEDV